MKEINNLESIWKETVAVIVLTGSNNLVLVKRKWEPFKGMWCLPGGAVEKGETLPKAAIREVKEETGLDIKILYALSQPYFESGYNKEKKVHYVYCPTCFVAKYISGNLKAQESECTDISYFNFSDIPKLAFSHNQMIIDFLESNLSKMCPRCNSKQIESSYNINGWDYVNSIKLTKINVCKSCGHIFDKTIEVTSE
jgi:8-oxo-dGTP diphosphatase